METWDIEIFFYEKNNRVYKAFAEEPAPKPNYETKSIIFITKPFTWGFYVSLNQRCARNGNINDIDYLLLKEKKLIEAVLDWNITDEKGKKVEVNKENIFNLSPIIVEALLNKYDEMCYVSKKEKRQLTLDINAYYLSQLTDAPTVKSAPFEAIELSLMERFHWSPDIIDKISYKRLQKLFMAMNQREVSSDAALRIKTKKNKK